MNEEINFHKELEEIKSSIHQLTRKVSELEHKYYEQPIDTLQQNKGKKEITKDLSAEASSLLRKAENEQAFTPNITQNSPKASLEEIKEKLKLPKISFINLFGAVTVVIAMVIFFKLAVDKGWIGPIARVTIGYLFGLAAIVVGEYCQKKSYTSASIGFLGLGQMALFLTTWFSERYFHLITWPLALTSYLAITALIVAQSLRYNSQAIAVFGILGGLLVPYMTSIEGYNFLFIGTYYFILTAGILFIAYKKSWKALKWISFIVNFMFLFVWALAICFSDATKRAENIDLQLSYYLPFLFIFFASYLAIACYRSLSLKNPLDGFDLSLVICTGAFSVLNALIALEGKHQAYVGIVCIFVAFIYAFICGEQLKRGIKSKKDFNTFLSIAVLFITVAIRLIVPIKFVSIAWALQAMLLAYFSHKKDLEFLKTNYLLILVIIVFRLLIVDELFSSAIDFNGIENGQGNIKKYSPFALPTISGLLSVVSFFYCLGQYEKSPLRVESNLNKDKDKNKNNSVVSLLLWAGVLFGSLVCFSREFYGFAYYSAESYLAADLHQFLLIIFVTLIVVAFCKTQLKQEHNHGKIWLINIFAGIVLLESLIHFYSITTYYTSSEALLSQITSFGLLFLLFALFILAKYLPVSSSREKLKTFMFGIGVLLIILFIRRETHLLTQSMENKDVCEMILSISYSLLALAIYVLGLLKQQKSKIWISYILFIFIGLKVYFNDLADLEQIYRGLSLLGFGSILLLCSFLEQKINLKRNTTIDSLVPLDSISQSDSQEES